MRYDPLKDRVFGVIRLFPGLRDIFFALLDRLLLRQRYVKREIVAYAKEGMSFYDAGAGFCQYSSFVLKKYPLSRVFATDLKTDYLKSFAAFSSGSFSYQSADLQSFIPRSRYDMAIAIDILEHIQGDVAAIQNLYRALKNEGVLIVSTPSDLDEAAHFTEEHVRAGYRKEELEEKLVSAGFEIEKSLYSYGIFGAASWKLMIKYPLQFLGKSRLNIIVLPFWYLLVYPISEVLMNWDLKRKNRKGNGIIIVARKHNSIAT